MILHGGDNGEMPIPVDQSEKVEHQPKYIFEMNYEEIKQQFKKTKYWLDSNQDVKCMVPQLCDLFELVNNSSNNKNEYCGSKTMN